MPALLYIPVSVWLCFIPLLIPLRSVPGAMLAASDKQLKELSLANSQSLRSHSLPIVLCLGIGPMTYSVIHVGMSIDIAIVQILFLQPFLGEMASQQISQYSASY